jgi:hypothetical protein
MRLFRARPGAIWRPGASTLSLTRERDTRGMNLGGGKGSDVDLHVIATQKGFQLALPFTKSVFQGVLVVSKQPGLLIRPEPRFEGRALHANPREAGGGRRKGGGVPVPRPAEQGEKR